MIALNRFHGRPSALLAGLAAFAIAFSAGTLPTRAQDSISLIRDTETERVLRSYLDPILVFRRAVAGGGARLSGERYLDQRLRRRRQNIFINTGTIMELETPNEIIGVMAHETGHMAAGHLWFAPAPGLRAAMIPMLAFDGSGRRRDGRGSVRTRARR